MEIKVLKNILNNNAHCATDNNIFLKSKNILAINLMASPGSGKTSFIIRTVENLKDKKVCVIEGDLESSVDTEKLIGLGIDAIQINTGGVCHLDANMIGHALKDMDTALNSILFIENVGNLVCTAPFDLGEDLKVVILSVAEGHDKPYKYPLIFEKADAIILNKIDLLPYVDFSKEEFYKGVRALNEKCPVFEVSCKTGEGIEDWVKWVRIIEN